MWGQPGHLIWVTTLPAGHAAAECPGPGERLTSGDMRPGTEDRSLGVGILTLSPDSPVIVTSVQCRCYCLFVARFAKQNICRHNALHPPTLQMRFRFRWRVCPHKSHPDPADKLLDLHFSHFELNWILCSVTNHPFTFVRSMSFIFCLNYGSWIRRISHVNLVLLPTMNNCLPMSGCIWRWEAPEHEEIRNWDIMKSVVRNSYFTLFYSFFAARLLHWVTGLVMYSNCLKTLHLNSLTGCVSLDKYKYWSTVCNVNLSTEVLSPLWAVR